MSNFHTTEAPGGEWFQEKSLFLARQSDGGGWASIYAWIRG